MIYDKQDLEDKEKNAKDKLEINIYLLLSKS